MRWQELHHPPQIYKTACHLLHHTQSGVPSLLSKALDSGRKEIRMSRSLSARAASFSLPAAQNSAFLPFWALLIAISSKLEL